MGIHIDAHRIEVLARDCEKVGPLAVPAASKAVESTAKDGNRFAADFARGTARRHGKWYPSAFSAEKYGLLSWIYGPVSARRQGGMSFEFGSRNQPPHLDVAKSVDIIRPLFDRRMAEAVGKALSGFERG